MKYEKQQLLNLLLLNIVKFGNKDERNYYVVVVINLSEMSQKKAYHMISNRFKMFLKNATNMKAI